MKSDFDELKERASLNFKSLFDDNAQQDKIDVS